MDDANALPDAGDRGGIDRGGDDDACCEQPKAGEGAPHVPADVGPPLQELEADRGGDREAVNFGHPSGTMRVGAAAELVDGQWLVRRALMSRSARVLMEGHVRVPDRNHDDPLGLD